MEYKQIKIIAIVLIVIGVIVLVAINSWISYIIDNVEADLDSLPYPTYPKNSVKWLYFCLYLLLLETIILFIALPILYLRMLKKKEISKQIS